MDNLSVSDKHYDKKYEDMQVRLDKLYDEIEEIENADLRIGEDEELEEDYRRMNISSEFL